MADLQAVQDERLRRTLRAIALAHPFYKAHFRTHGIDPDKIRSIDDLASLPPTRKDDYIADPEAFRLQAADLPDDFTPAERVLWDIAYTTGTTSGKPSPFYNTTHDAYAIWDQARRCNEAEGVQPTDRIANLYPLADFPTGAFLSVIRSGMIAGIPVINGMTGSAQSEFKVRHSLGEALEKVTAFKPTVLWGVPSFVRRFLDEAKRQGRDLSAARLVITSGEPVPPALRAEMKALLAACGAGDVQFRARYAFTEMQGGLVQCADDAGGQNVTPDLYHLEVVDPETFRRLPDGESGHARDHASAPARHRAAAVSGWRHRYAVARAVPALRADRRAGGADAAPHRQPSEMSRHAGEHRRGDRPAVGGRGDRRVPDRVHARRRAGRDGSHGDPDRAGRGGCGPARAADRRRAAGGVAAARGRVCGARRALRPGAVDQGAAGGRSAAEGGLNGARSFLIRRIEPCLACHR
jgi:hypothetical protein